MNTSPQRDPYRSDHLPSNDASNPPKWPLWVAGICFAIGIVIAVSGVFIASARDTKLNATADPLSVPSSDPNVRRLVSPMGGTVLVASTKQVLDRLADLGLANDVEGINRIISLGLAWSVRSGTKARVIDRGFMMTEVRVLEGPRNGRSGFVLSEFVKR